MSKKPQTNAIEKFLTTGPNTYAYSIFRKENGYGIKHFEIQNGKIVNETVVVEPDVLAIAMAKLEKIIRKQYGI